MLVALTGVGGTLGATALGQRGTSRAKAAEHQIRQAERLAEWAREDTLRYFTERHVCYVNFLAAVRYLNLELIGCLVPLRNGERPSETLRERLDEALLNYRTRHAEASLILPADVYAVATEVNKHLNQAWDAFTRVDANPEAADPFVVAELSQHVEDARPVIRRLRHAMRADLGIETQPTPE